jgi:outer membrane protein OmpA-like peptidoglycan-associated protein
LKIAIFNNSKPYNLSESFGSIKNLAAIINSNKNLTLQIETHTDNILDRKSIVLLSVARAEAIKALMVGMGVPSYQLKTKGFGASKPITDNRDEAHRRKNRRVEIEVISN